MYTEMPCTTCTTAEVCKLGKLSLLCTGPRFVTLTCVFLLKSFVIVTPRCLMFSAFSRTVPSNVYEAWIFFIPFFCQLHHIAFDRLNSHTPFPGLINQYLSEVSRCPLCP